MPNLLARVKDHLLVQSKMGWLASQPMLNPPNSFENWPGRFSVILLIH